MNRRDVLRFGIPTLDSLLGAAPIEAQRPDKKDAGARPRVPSNHDCGFHCPAGASASICLIGSHGTGKSVLALHFASRYFADFLDIDKPPARIFYVSTDLSHPMASDLWRNFALSAPNLRRVPSDQEYGTIAKRAREQHPEWRLPLVRRTPYAYTKGGETLAQFIAGAYTKREVTFVDLAAESAGDDWGFIHRLIAVLNEPSAGAPRHLVVVDAVEGLETLVGESDAFGEKTSRRARIAQMLRTASRKCHLLLVVEERKANQRVPEEFVSDVVIRLRSVRASGFDRRTVEVQKVRGQSHIRGQHPYVIRSGIGSSTGAFPNLDDRMVTALSKGPGSVSLEHLNPPSAVESPISGVRGESIYDETVVLRPRSPQAYFFVMRSLHYLTRTIMYERGFERPERNLQVAGFGIPHLDSLLSSSQTIAGQGDEYGLPCSTITALIGDAGTHKSVLGQCFLYKAVAAELEGQLNKGVFNGTPGIAILFTTSDIDAGRLADTFLHWAATTTGATPDEKEKNEVRHQLIDRIICRRLEIHNQIPEVLVHIVQSAVTEAQRRLRIRDEPSSAVRYTKSWPIRLVIDDFSLVTSMYPAVRKDPLLLPFLAFFLRREGISTLIIDTQPARPDAEPGKNGDDPLRAVVDNHLHTWRIPFHVESRIAITAMPPIHSSGRARIREVRWDPNEYPPALPEVDRSLELYTGLEKGEPRQIPLEVRLYTETQGLCTYVKEMNSLLEDLFVPLESDAADVHREVVTGIGAHQYSYLHDLCNLQGQRVLDHTLILQVDEFWTMPATEKGDAEKNASPHPLRDEAEYLSVQLETNEPRQLFIGLRTVEAHSKANTQRGHRASYFGVPDCPLEENGLLIDGIDRVPFMWEFGFLLCRRKLWIDDEDVNGEYRQYVRSVLDRLPHAEGRLETEFDDGTLPLPKIQGQQHRASWCDFMKTCKAISKHVSYRNERVAAFDISTISGESFSCLMLEIWASEIYERLGRSSAEGRQFAAALSKKRWSSAEQSGHGLLEWLRNESYRIDLYMSWLLVVDTLPMGDLAQPGASLSFSERLASPEAVASRQWYKTASEMLAQRKPSEPMMAVGLPGHFSTRGDWYLAVARGSKSDLLADRALDIFSSRRNNFTRLYSGLGLPTRTLGEEKEMHAFLTALGWTDRDGKPRCVHYAELCALGGASQVPTGYQEVFDGEAGEFFWLWRSALRNYHRQARVFQRWNTHTVLVWNDLKARYGSTWHDCLDLYDELAHDRPKTIGDMDKVMDRLLKDKPINSWALFCQRVELLERLLEHADSSEPPSPRKMAATVQ